MDELVDSLHKLLGRFGITAAASGFVSGPRAATGNPFHFANWPPEWIALYTAEEFLLADPLPRWARRSGRAIAWSDLFLLLPARDPGRRVIEAAAKFGFTEGMAIPMRAADSSLGLISFGGGRGPFSAAEQISLTFLGRAAFEAAEQIERGTEPVKVGPILTSREIECLVLLVRGHSSQRIGKVLGVSESTIRFHLGNARDKMGAVSQTHLAALALTQGFVSL